MINYEVYHEEQSLLSPNKEKIVAKKRTIMRR